MRLSPTSKCALNEPISLKKLPDICLRKHAIFQKHKRNIFHGGEGHYLLRAKTIRLPESSCRCMNLPKGDALTWRYLPFKFVQVELDERGNC